MRKRLFIYTTLIIFAGLLCFFMATVFLTNENNLSIAKDAVTEMARIYADLYGGLDDIPKIVSIPGDTRVTIISPDGAVLADSAPLDLEHIENHLNRPEIQAALNDAPEAFIRYSSSLGVDLIYYALKVDDGSGYVIIRTAVSVAKINAYLYQSLPLLIIMLIAVALMCFGLSRGMINQITKPFAAIEQKLRLLADGGYKAGPVEGGYEEVDKIIVEIDEIALLLQNNMADLRDEKTKAEYIINNIGDGIFAIDAERNISFINNAALVIFDVTPEIAGKKISYLTGDVTLTAAAEDCVNNEKSALLELSLNGRIYLVTIKRLPGIMLVMAILSDITANRENEKQREEFFANASHELKTPLTAIKGLNELTALNNKDETIDKYIGGITRETDRMLALIGDMLRLSGLENARNVNPVAVSLAKTALEVRETLSAAINEKNVSFSIAGEGFVQAEREHAYELIKNIAENAVRYNNDGGSVSVSFYKSKGNAFMAVADDGVGISPDEQTRIFERFYRVEKSRSHKSGGTGLGLSIVKHVCALYGWKLTLKSKPGVGTEILIDFGKPPPL